MDNNFLPSWAYEGLRYLSAILLPGVATLLSALNAAWNWGWPMDGILATFVAVETFIGAVFLGSKIATDNANASNTVAELEATVEEATKTTKKATTKKK